MYCSKCGTQNNDNNFKCTKCGTIIQKMTAAPIQVKKSNTAVIVLVVVGVAIGLVMIIGILAAIAIPGYIGMQARARNTQAQAELRNICNSAVVFFSEHPDKTITLDDLREKGISSNPEIELAIENGTMGSLSILAKHSKGNRTYVADNNCNIIEMQH